MVTAGSHVPDFLRDEEADYYKRSIQNDNNGLSTGNPNNFPNS